MQPVDYTTLLALCSELQTRWLPARCEQVYQRDRYTLALALRTFDQRGWLTISWHPQAARLHIGDAPPRTPDTFTFSEQLRHQLNGFALIAIEFLEPWERAVDLQFARRPGDPVIWHLYVEIMGKYSNVVLTNAQDQIVTLAHQVNQKQSSVRPLLTGQAYQAPPPLMDPIPSLQESQDRWQERVSLLPGPLVRRLRQAYRGLSSALVKAMLEQADLDVNVTVEQLTPAAWHRLFQVWQTWLHRLSEHDFTPIWRQDGYNVLGWGAPAQAPGHTGSYASPVLEQPIPPGQADHTAIASDIQTLINRYYTDALNRETFSRLHHQLSQKLQSLLTKLRQKAATFQTRLDQSAQADQYRQQADLLMAHLHQWQPGMTAITLADFETREPVTIALNPEKNAVQNAQALYKQHQKLRRARQAVTPMLAAVLVEVAYLEQVDASLAALSHYGVPTDLDALYEIREELVQQGYGVGDERSTTASKDATPNFYRYQTPHGFEVLIGRNNRQNEYLTFRTATDYDLWFHTQEIPGSHVLLRVDPGAAPDEVDLQFAANLAAYFSRARQADQVPVVYTEPRHVYKPKGAHPGMVVYKKERVLWGQPQGVRTHLMALTSNEAAVAL